MLLTITCDGPHAADLGFLLHKNPGAVFERETSYGRVTVFYPENRAERATAALLVEIDPVGLVRGDHRAVSLEQYVNDRPFVASSFTSVALKEAFSSALAGRSKDRPALVAEPLPLRARIPAVSVSGGIALVERLFKPLGYEVSAAVRPLDETFARSATAPRQGAEVRRPPAWRESQVVALELAARTTLRELLTHLYVLLPVLDNDKHYFVGADEVEKLVGHGEGWLAAHPEKVLITNRYLAYQRGLVRDALSQLTLGQGEADEAAQEREDALEERVRLHDQRLAAVLAALRSPADPPIRRVVDLGCGEGKLVRMLLDDRQFSEVVGADVSSAALERAERRLALDRKPQHVRDRVKLLQSSLVYADRRLEGYDAIALVEVIEHLDPFRLDVARKVLFARLRPRRVVLTTPNAEYNVRFETLPAGRLRHADHRFEWTRAELRAWAAGAEAHGYTARFVDVGPVDPEVGAPTQMAIFDQVRVTP